MNRKEEMEFILAFVEENTFDAEVSLSATAQPVDGLLPSLLVGCRYPGL